MFLHIRPHAQDRRSQRGRLQRILAVGAAAIALGYPRRSLEPTDSRLGARKSPPQKLSSLSGESRSGSISKGSSEKKERRLLQLIDRVLSRIDEGGDGGRGLGAHHDLTGIDREA